MARHSALTLEQCFERFYASSLLKQQTRNGCRSAWRHLMAMLGQDCSLDVLGVEHIERLQAMMRTATSKRGRPFSDRSIRTTVMSIGQVCKWAVRARLMTANPVHNADKIRPVKRKPDPYTMAEVSELVVTLRGSAERGIEPIRFEDPTTNLRLAAMIFVAMSDPRLNEITNLRRCDIDLEARVIHIRARVDTPPTWWEWHTKNRENRTVPIFDQEAEILRELLATCDWEYPIIRKSTCLHYQERIGQLTEWQRYCPYTDFHTQLRRVWKKTNWRLRAEHKPEIPIRGGLPFHGIRKTSATEMVRAGVSTGACQRLLGHATDELTRTVYIGLNQEAADLAAGRTALNTLPKIG